MDEALGGGQTEIDRAPGRGTDQDGWGNRVGDERGTRVGDRPRWTDRALRRGTDQDRRGAREGDKPRKIRH